MYKTSSATPFMVPSFTERVLLSKYSLDLICPTNCKKTYLAMQGSSLMETLGSLEINPFKSETKGAWNWSTKPIKSVGRVVFIALITITVSPLGMLWNGVRSVEHLAKYKIADRDHYSSTKEWEWETTKAYAKAFFTDFTCFASGALSCALIIGGVYLISQSATGLYFGKSIVFQTFKDFSMHTTADKIGGIFMGFCTSSFGVYNLGLFYPSEIVSRLLGSYETRGPMFLALELRNQLGIVGKNGKLLEFSTTDKFDPNNPNSKGIGSRLFDLTYDLEMDLIQIVAKANHWYKEKTGKEIPFSFPFNGEVVAKQLLQSLEQVKMSQTDKLSLGVLNDDAQVIYDLSKQLISIQKKLTLLQTLFYDSFYVSLKGSLIEEYFLAAGGRSKPIEIPRLKSFLDETRYGKYYEAAKLGSRGIPKNPEKNGINSILQGLSFPAIDPKNAPEQTGLYKKFKQKLQTEKWKMENGLSVANAHEFLELKQGCKYHEYRTKWNQYSRRVHPDKHGGHNAPKEVQELFQAFSGIAEIIREKEEL